MSIKFRFAIPLRNVAFLAARIITDNDLQPALDELADESIELTVDTSVDVVKEVYSMLPALITQVEDVITRIQTNADNTTERRAADGRHRDIFADIANRRREEHPDAERGARERANAQHDSTDNTDSGTPDPGTDLGERTGPQADSN